MPLLSKRLDFFTDSVIRRMTRIANQHGSINLSQGFPDFDPPEEIKNELAKVAFGNKHQYAITWGAKSFRDALVKKQSKYMGFEINPETQVVVTCGSTEAMIAAMMTVCNPGDKVVVFSPFYENYVADTILSGAKPIYVPLKPPTFEFDKTELEAAFKQNPKALILCNPSNPTGKVYTLEELEFIAYLAKKYDVFVITDEVYEHIVYKPNKHIYFASLPDMFERTLSCSSLSKTYSMTGWRLGYLIAPFHIIDGARKVHDFLTVGAAAPLQEAAVVGLEFGEEYYDGLEELYTKKKKFFLDGLDKLKLTYFEPQGAYYVLIDISEWNVDSDLEFCEWMAKVVGVAAVPGSSFFKEDIKIYVRLHFAKNIETLEAALEKLETLREKANLKYNKLK